MGIVIKRCIWIARRKWLFSWDRSRQRSIKFWRNMKMRSEPFRTKSRYWREKLRIKATILPCSSAKFLSIQTKKETAQKQKTTHARKNIHLSRLRKSHVASHKWCHGECLWFPRFWSKQSAEASRIVQNYAELCMCMYICVCLWIFMYIYAELCKIMNI